MIVDNLSLGSGEGIEVSMNDTGNQLIVHILVMTEEELVYINKVTK